MRPLLSPLPAARPLRQRWIWRGRIAGRSGGGQSPFPCTEGSGRPFAAARAELCVPARPGGPRGRRSGVNPSRLSPLHQGRLPGQPASQDPPSPQLAALSSGHAPSGPITAPRGRSEPRAMPPAPAELPARLRGPEPPGRSRPAASTRTRAGAALPDLEQQDDDGRQVGQIPGEAEDVHGGGRGGGAAGAGERRWRKLSGHRATWPGDVARQPRAGARREAGGGGERPPRPALRRPHGGAATAPRAWLGGGAAAAQPLVSTCIFNSECDIMWVFYCVL